MSHGGEKRWWSSNKTCRRNFFKSLSHVDHPIMAEFWLLIIFLWCLSICLIKCQFISFHLTSFFFSFSCFSNVSIFASEFLILAFFDKFCPFKIDLSGKTIWPQTSGLKTHHVEHFWHERSWLRSQCWMRLFLRFLNTVSGEITFKWLTP